MNKVDKNRPVSSIKHDDKRAAIPDSAHQGEEQMAISGMLEQSEYDIFRHEFQRGRDPELYWLNKYKNDDEDNPDYMPQLRTDIRSLYKHEDIRPEAIIDSLYELHEHKSESAKLQLDLFGDFEEEQEDELERLAGYYKHSDNWQNRLIQGDSLLVMNSLLNREGMKGQVQCIYFDPPYGIKYGGNWQMKINSRDVKDSDNNISGEPEMIKAYRDTWEFGIHSYLSYLRDRLIMARELLTESGSCFVQISDENVHLVRNLMDEIFGSENFVSQIVYTKTAGFTSNTIGNVADFVIWYAKDIEQIKVRKLYIERNPLSDPHYNSIELADGRRMTISEWEKENEQTLDYKNRPKGSKVYRITATDSQGSAGVPQPLEFNGKIYNPPKSRHWTVNYPNGMQKLIDLGRIIATDNSLGYIRYFEDFPMQELNNVWDDILGIQSRKDPKVYVVQTSTKTI